MNLHICLLSAQLLPNYLPIKLERPDHVLLINSQFTLNKGYTQRFEKMLDDLGVKYSRASQLAPTDDFTELHEYFLDLSNEIKSFKSIKVTLNLTGGTKLMAIAANEMLRTAETRVIYTNTQAGKIEVISNPANNITLPDLLTINEYLIAYGVAPKSYNNQKADWVAAVNRRKALTKTLINHFTKDSGFLGKLNYHVQQALESIPNSYQKRLSQPTQYLGNHLNHHRLHLLRQIEKNGLIKFESDNTIRFESVAAAEYLGGFWLEEYAYCTAVDVGIAEVRCGQAIQWDKTTRNELDIVLIHDNRLLIMECKTRRYSRDRRKDNDSIYKLDSVAEDLRGLYGEKWLLSVDHIDQRTDKRAKSQGIRLIAGDRLKTLKNELIKWRDKNV